VILRPSIVGLLGLVVLAGCGGTGKPQSAATTAATASGPAPSRTPASIAVPPPAALTTWSVDSDNLVAMPVRVTSGGAPVTGALLRVDGYELPPTDADGRATYVADSTRLARHVVTVADVGQAKIAGAPLTAGTRAAVSASHASLTVAYPIRGVTLGRDAGGNPTVSGRIAYGDGTPPPEVSRYTYQLTGTVTDSGGHPVADARVSTRTVDRDYWTVSSPTDAQGRYDSLFTASDEGGGDPVLFTVRVSVGDVVYQFLSEEFVSFERLRSAQMDIRLPPRGYPIALPLPRSYPGAVYEGIVVGAASGGKPVKPVSASWPDATGRFRMTLPRSLAGKPVTLWEAKLDLFSVPPATPGGTIDLRGWPALLPPDAPRDLARVRLR
jgi:hypothetical protein